MSKAQKRAAAVVAVTVAPAFWLTGCGGSSVGTPPKHANAASFLSVDSAAKRVRLTLAMAYDRASSSQNIDGAVKGALLFSVPTGWRVSVECANRSKGTHYACALAPAPGVAVGQRGLVYIFHPAAGLAPGAHARFTFVPTSPSRYRMVALIEKSGAFSPAAGMWVVLRVSQGGQPAAQWLR